MEERESPGAKGCYDQVQNAKWEIPDFSPRIGDNNIKDGCFLNRILEFNLFFVWNIESTLELDYEGTGILMGPSGPYFEFIYLVDTDYEIKDCYLSNWKVIGTFKRFDLWQIGVLKGINKSIILFLGLLERLTSTRMPKVLKQWLSVLGLKLSSVHADSTKD
uniref:Uncharacterized protein n=1 Tax=Vitis vinifera TaxID=29760 RepID=F6I4Z5_VITVI